MREKRKSDLFCCRVFWIPTRAKLSWVESSRASPLLVTWNLSGLAWPWSAVVRLWTFRCLKNLFLSFGGGRSFTNQPLDSFDVARLLPGLSAQREWKHKTTNSKFVFLLTAANLPRFLHNQAPEHSAVYLRLTINFPLPFFSCFTLKISFMKSVASWLALSKGNKNSESLSEPWIILME